LIAVIKEEDMEQLPYVISCTRTIDPGPGKEIERDKLMKYQCATEAMLIKD